MNGFTIARIFGIRIRVQWSLIFIFLLVLVNLGGGLFPMWHPEWSAVLCWSLAAAAALLLLVSILVHELSHSLVGRAMGVEVHSITLFIFGGAANIEKEPDSPKAELLMSIVGPLTSLAIGLGFMWIGGAMTGPAGDDGGRAVRAIRGASPLATLLLWLGPVNVVLAVFNMLPGFPLDGGRVLRAALWHFSGDLLRATRWAARVGQTFGWTMIMAGIVMMYGFHIPFLGTGLVAGLWLLFIGWFLNTAAASSYSQMVVRNLLQELPVSRLMRRDVPTVTPDVTLARLVEDYVLPPDIKAFPVVEGEALAGLISLADVRRVPRGEWETTPVRDVMTPASHLAMIDPGEDVWEALRGLGQREVSQLPVVQHGHLLGVISRADILKWLSVQSERDLAQAH